MTIAAGRDALADYDAILAEIRAEMARQNINQSSLARTLGVNRDWVSRRLKTDTPMTVGDLVHIAGALHMPAHVFLLRAGVQ